MRFVAKTLGFVVALFAAYIAYCIYQDHRAERAANEFCDNLEVGSTASGIADRARAAGHRVMDRQEGLAVHFQGRIFNAFLCEVTVADGKVAGKQVTSMDD